MKPGFERVDVDGAFVSDDVPEDWLCSSGGSRAVIISNESLTAFIARALLGTLWNAYFIKS